LDFATHHIHVAREARQHGIDLLGTVFAMTVVSILLRGCVAIFG